MDLEGRGSLQVRNQSQPPHGGQAAYQGVHDDDDDDNNNDEDSRSEASHNDLDSSLMSHNSFPHPSSATSRQHHSWHPLSWFHKSEQYDRLEDGINLQDGPEVKPKLPGGTAAIFWQSLLNVLFSSKWNISMVFVPIGLVAYVLEAHPIAVFITNGIAIVPLSALLTNATERIASEVGDTIGALLNITLGNLVELILLVALKDGHTRIVEASILGSILVNILLILGSALLLCSLFDIQDFRPTASSQILGCLLFVSVFAFLIPTAFQSAFDSEDKKHSATLKMSRITACIVLMIYLLYMFHELRSPHESKQPSAKDPEQALSSESLPADGQGLADAYPLQTVSNSQNQLGLPPRTIRFAEEGNMHANAGNDPALPAEAADIPADSGREQPARAAERRPVQAPTSAYRSHQSRTRPGRSSSLGSASRPRSSDGLDLPDRRYAMVLPTMRSMRPSLDDINIRRTVDRKQPREHASIERAVSIFILVVTSALMSMNAEFLVSTIDQITHQGGFSEAIIGLIILPIVGNMAEYVTVVTVAIRENLELAVAVSVGSSIQIALCVAPLTVLAGWLLDRDLLLTFNFFEMATLMGTILLVNIIALTGATGGSSSNALRGGLICGCYAIIAVGAYLDPETS